MHGVHTSESSFEFLVDTLWTRYQDREIYRNYYFRTLPSDGWLQHSSNLAFSTNTLAFLSEIYNSEETSLCPQVAELQNETSHSTSDIGVPSRCHHTRTSLRVFHLR
jgi:hypothetical protein